MIVFVGPTLRAHDVPAGIEARPPAQCGDIASAAADGARSIGLIDGHFETTASPWHKEILWAMARGVRVYGAASMGALRAAELHRHGMIGIGRVFEDYRDGTLTDDDEVAISHGPAEAGYATVSEAMVNIRATLALARRGKIIDKNDQQGLTAIAKSLFFKERGYERMMIEAKRSNLARPMLRRLADWLPANKQDIKRADALLLLHRMRKNVGCGQHAAQFDFPATMFWNVLAKRLDLPS